MDRAAGDPGAAGAGPLSSEAGAAAQRLEGAGACGDGQRRVLPRVSDVFGPAGTRQLDALELGAPFAQRVASLREFVVAYDCEITRLEREIHQHLKGHAGYRAIQAVNGIGRVSAAVLVTEIGDVSRFPTPAHLCCWCGLTPRHRESDLKTPIWAAHSVDMTCTRDVPDSKVGRGPDPVTAGRGPSLLLTRNRDFGRCGEPCLRPFTQPRS
jgi:hypothetical protein